MFAEWEASLKALTLAIVAVFATTAYSVAKPPAPREPAAQREPEPQEQPGAYLVVIATTHSGGVAISNLPFESLPKCEAAAKVAHPGGGNSPFTAEYFCVPQ
jgi:hypothetical protein